MSFVLSGLHQQAEPVLLIFSLYVSSFFMPVLQYVVSHLVYRNNLYVVFLHLCYLLADLFFLPPEEGLFFLAKFEHTALQKIYSL
jgi:hypothetical protein